MTHIKIKAPLAIGFFIFTLAGCGGGGSNTPTQPRQPTPPVASGPTWQPGVYEPSANFAARCASVRTGNDPISGLPYPDVAGSALTEKLWLRSWTDETYLWFDEVPDNNPANFTVAAYFDQLKTDARTASGKLKDNFHFSEPTDEYNERTQVGTSSEYGIKWEFVSLRAPRELIVRYTEPDSPAAAAQISRGASLKRINNIDFVNTENDNEIDTINAALFPSDPGASYTFEFEDLNGELFSVDLTSANIELSPVQNVSILSTNVGRVGYMQFNTFITPAQGDLIDAFQRFVDENVSELVIDLRYNGGGSLALSSQIAYMVAGPNQTNNSDFERILYNSKRSAPDPIPFYDREIDYVNGFFTDNTLPSPALTRVFVLSSDNTCSASESLINGLRGIDVEVILIGDTTCGKPFGFFPEDNCGTTYFTIQLQGVNEKGFGDYADGFSPVASPVFDDEVRGCSVADDFTQALGSPDEAMLGAALYFAENGTCPEGLASPQSDIDSLQQGTGPAIAAPNRFIESIVNDDRTIIKKRAN
ncbi:S41 family peptidase [Glaciecola siphonariae]|uniref:S41 family peptidase n=1 Tax=Glaciecola siphonariae TaxID=521012 RepID=A0ABV9LTS0_9ALTE